MGDCIPLDSQQLRTRDCHDCTIMLFAVTDPIIETSHHMLFGPWNGAYPHARTHFEAVCVLAGTGSLASCSEAAGRPSDRQEIPGP